MLRIEKQRIEQLPPPLKRKIGTRYRCQMYVRKTDRSFNSDALFHTSKYIDRETNHIIATANMPNLKGNGCRTLFNSDIVLKD